MLISAVKEGVYLVLDISTSDWHYLISDVFLLAVHQHRRQSHQRCAMMNHPIPQFLRPKSFAVNQDILQLMAQNVKHQQLIVYKGKMVQLGRCLVILQPVCQESIEKALTTYALFQFHFIIGCSIPTEDEDCLRTQECSDSKCIERKCENLDSANQYIKLKGNSDTLKCQLPEDDEFLGRVGCQGLMKCKPGFVYKVSPTKRVKEFPAICTRNGKDKHGTWHKIDKEMEAIMPCEKG